MLRHRELFTQPATVEQLHAWASTVELELRYLHDRDANPSPLDRTRAMLDPLARGTRSEPTAHTLAMAVGNVQLAVSDPEVLGRSGDLADRLAGIALRAQRHPDTPTYLDAAANLAWHGLRIPALSVHSVAPAVVRGVNELLAPHGLANEYLANAAERAVPSKVAQWAARRRGTYRAIWGTLMGSPAS